MLKVVALSYRILSDFIRSLECAVPPGVSFRIIDVLLSNIPEITRKLERNGEVDLYVSAGANARQIAQVSAKPLVEISVTGFDVLNALHALSSKPGGAAVVTYQGVVQDMNPAFGALGIRAVHRTYRSPEDLDRVLRDLKEQGVRKVVCTSLGMEKAAGIGLEARLIYTPDGVRDAIERCFHIAMVRQAEAEKAYTLQTLLHYAHSGIIAADEKGTITECNGSAEKMLGLSRKRVLGKHIDRALPGFSGGDILARKEEEINSLKTVNGVNLLANSIPITAGGKTSGLVITFQDIGSLSESERAVRRTLYQKGFYARADFDGILGGSRALLGAKEQARLYAQSDSAMVITGESGTGKELFAQAIHNAGPRSRGPFVPINCASLPPNLLQSELFGYAEGSFTGAKKGGKPGLFEMADKGTLFLDEIGEIPKSIQALLLRAVETREVMRVGGEQIFSADVRVIAATNRNLWAMVTVDEFREDLYYRLCTLQLVLPPLRDRREDIPLPMRRFLSTMRHDLPPDVLDALANEPLLVKSQWHGNIRELRNVAERFAVLFQPAEDPVALLQKIVHDRDRKFSAGDFANQERNEIFAALKEAKGNKAKAAKKLGVSRTTLWRKLQELG